MGAKAKIAGILALLIIVILAVWQFTSPAQLPPVGNKYISQQIYTNRGTWTVLENMTDGRAFLAFSIANTSYPRAGVQTFYSLTISNLNQSIATSYVKGFGLRITSITIQDNYDGSSSNWGIASGLSDAIQANGLFSFRTSAVHQLRFTVNYQLYDLMIIGYKPDKILNDSFNITQTVL